jgi:hypothetical protein
MKNLRLILVCVTAKAYKKMLADPEHDACTVHRTAVLDDSRLIASVEEMV